MFNIIGTNINFEINDLIKINGGYKIYNQLYNRDKKISFKCVKCNKTINTSIRMILKRKKFMTCINCTRKEIIKEKYGVENISQLDNVQRIIRNNNLIKYGVTSTSKLDEIKQKVKNTSMLRYGVTNGGASKEAQDKIKKSMILKYGCHYMQTEEAVRLNRKNGYGIKNGKYKTIFGNELFGSVPRKC